MYIYRFLNEPWAQPLFHDRFRSYMKRLRNELMNPEPSSVPLLPLGSSSDENDHENTNPMEMKEILDRLYIYVSNNEVVCYYYYYYYYLYMHIIYIFKYVNFIYKF